MKVLIVYDSWYGNTKKVAKRVAKVLGEKAKVNLVKVDELKATDIEGIELLVLGSPVHGGRPSEKTMQMMDKLDKSRLKGMKVGVFDTRMEIGVQSWWLKGLMKMIGFAADKMAGKLQRRGVKLVVGPEGFIVVDKEGPLKEGELERAGEWAGKILKASWD